MLNYMGLQMSRSTYMRIIFPTTYVLWCLHDPRLIELTDPRPQIQKAHWIFNCAGIRVPDLCVVGQLIMHNDYRDKASVSGISHNYLCACVYVCVLRTFKIYTPGHSQYTVQYC